jgi:hypothetical protein
LREGRDALSFARSLHSGDVTHPSRADNGERRRRRGRNGEH